MSLNSAATDPLAAPLAPLIRRARPDEAPQLTAIAFAAKRHWGYPEAWIEQWSAALTLSPEEIARHPTFAAIVNGRPAGFYSLRLDLPAARLEHLWVAPAAMGRRFGQALFIHAETQAGAAGCTRLTLTGDPHAEGFYRRMGAVVVGHEPAPMNGVDRALPLFQKDLSSPP